MADYGKLALFISCFASLLIFAHFYMGVALSKFFSESQMKDSTDYLGFLTNAFFLAFVSSSLSFFVIVLFLKHVELLTPVVGIACFLGFLFLAIATINSGALIGLFKMQLSASVSVFIAGARFILMLLATAVGFKSLEGAVVVYAIAAFVPFVFSVLAIDSNLRNEDKRRFYKLIEVDRMKKIINFSQYITFAYVMINIMWFFSRWILTIISYEMVAIYDGACLVYSIPHMGFGALVVALVPHVARQESIGKQKLRFPPMKKLIILYLIASVIVIGARNSALDQKFLNALSLEKYIGSLPLFYIMFLAIPIDFLFGVASSILQGLGKTRELFRIVLLVTPMHITGTYLLAKSNGAYGAAIMFVITYGFLAILGYIKVKKL